jgi:hypothetical protein
MENLPITTLLLLALNRYLSDTNATTRQSRKAAKYGGAVKAWALLEVYLRSATIIGRKLEIPGKE